MRRQTKHYFKVVKLLTSAEAAHPFRPWLSFVDRRPTQTAIDVYDGHDHLVRYATQVRARHITMRMSHDFRWVFLWLGLGDRLLRSSDIPIVEVDENVKIRACTSKVVVWRAAGAYCGCAGTYLAADIKK